MKGNFISWNGGGARTLLELDCGVYLYEKLGNKFFRHFDIIAGASGGALITGMIACNYNPIKIKEIYKEELPGIFSGGCLREIRGKSKFSNDYLREVANHYIGSIELGDLIQKIFIPVVNSTLQQPKIFKSWEEKDKKFKLVDVIVSSAAAPRYFPAVEINKEWYKDGGLAMNNPVDMLALETKNPKLGYTEVNILSITSGINKDIVTKAEKKGSILSIPEMIDEMLILQDRKSHTFTEKLIDYGIIKGNYERCDAEIENSSGKIDDVSSRNIEAMLKDSQLTMLKNKGKLNEFYLRSLEE